MLCLILVIPIPATREIITKNSKIAEDHNETVNMESSENLNEIGELESSNGDLNEIDKNQSSYEREPIQVRKSIVGQKFLNEIRNSSDSEQSVESSDDSEIEGSPIADYLNETQNLESNVADSLNEFQNFSESEQREEFSDDSYEESSDISDFGKLIYRYNKVNVN